MKKILFLVAVIFAFQAMPVLAENPEDVEVPEQKKEKPLSGDIDGDGFISKAEYLERAEERFDVMDQTNDGKLSREEMRAAHIKRKAEMDQRKAQNKANQEYYDKKLDREKKKLERLGTSITR